MLIKFSKKKNRFVKERKTLSGKYFSRVELTLDSKIAVSKKKHSIIMKLIVNFHFYAKESAGKTCKRDPLKENSFPKMISF